MKIDQNILSILVIVSIIMNIVCMLYIIILKNKYINYIRKLGKGENLVEMLKSYINSVEDIKRDNEEIKAYYTTLVGDIDSCVQKVGLVRYNAFRDVGSDLSFALALLDRNDDGVVLNGLFGSDSSNIFAKPIKGGNSKYQLSEEEKEAINIAEQSKNFYMKNRINKY